jgi:ABC-2 type transport system ATP-binding protein
VAACIATRGLAKVYRGGQGLHGLDLEIPEGEIFGFLGPNGAGKTTTLRTLLGLVRPTAGEATVLGRDVVRDSLAVRAVTGYLPGEPALYDNMTGRQHLDLALALRGIADRSRAQAIEDRLGVEMGRKVGQLSRGNRQKVGILLALAHDPAVLLLDEPANGLDPPSQDALHNLVREERGRGKTVVFSSHVLPEVEAISDRVGILREGRLVATDALAALRRSRTRTVAARFEGEVPDLSGLAGAADLSVSGERVTLRVTGDLGPLLRRLGEQPPIDLTIQDPSLEEAFRAYYGEAAAR